MIELIGTPEVETDIATMINLKDMLPRALLKLSS